MTRDQFWQIITDAKKSVDDFFEMHNYICENLAKMPNEEILAYNENFNKLMQDSNRWDLFAAATIISGGCSDDEFEYFRCWLISMGQKCYEDASQNPDNIANYIREDWSYEKIYKYEEMPYVAANAYRLKNCDNNPDCEIPEILTGFQAGDLQGMEWKEEDLPGLIPELYKITGREC